MTFPKPPPLLAALDEAELIALHGYGVDTHVPAGTTMIEQGKDHARLYIIVDGRLIVSRNNEGESIDLAELRAGEIFGEVSVFDPGPASATVKTSADCKLWHIDGSELERFVEANPAAGTKILRKVAKELAGRVRVLDANVETHGGGHLAEGWW